jgi:ABC-type molybdenum transport system ATPase subunit/photorepair protein PhrA
LYFNSYRKIQEAAPELGMLVDTRREPFLSRRYPLSVVSFFKIQILRSVMLGNKTYVNPIDNKDSESILSFFNTLLIKYAHVTFKKLEPKEDNTVEIVLEHQDSKQEFPFDGLSSGQKEIISTLFLIWYHTQDSPKIVLIDEPELHLNRDWQQTFIQDLVRIAPHNQYIVATHSVEVAQSVESYQRLLLR